MIAFLLCPTVPLLRFRQPITLFRYADKRIVNVMKVYIKMNNLQLELMRYRKHFDFIHVYFCEVTGSIQFHPPIIIIIIMAGMAVV